MASILKGVRRSLSGALLVFCAASSAADKDASILFEAASVGFSIEILPEWRITSRSPAEALLHDGLDERTRATRIAKHGLTPLVSLARPADATDEAGATFLVQIEHPPVRLGTADGVRLVRWLLVRYLPMVPYPVLEASPVAETLGGERVGYVRLGYELASPGEKPVPFHTEFWAVPRNG